MTWWQQVLLGVVGLAGVAGVGTPAYWKLVQANPEIVACEPPVMNDGVGVDGVRPPGANMMLPAVEWKPVEKHEFKRGTTAWVLRNDMFLNKVSGPVQRALIHDDGITIYTLPLIYPPKTTPSGRCSRANFNIPLPKDMKPGGYTYSVNVIMRKNPLEPEVFTPFHPVKFAVVE